MITGSRNMLQTSIDERAEVIERIITSVPELIHIRFLEYEKQAQVIARDNSDGDQDVYSTILSNVYGAYRPEDEEWMVLEFYRAMVMLICSFAETTIKRLLKNPGQSFGSNYLCNAYNQVNRESGLGLETIGNYWPEHQDFTQKRNDITHNRKDVIVSQGELLKALSGVHTLLRAVADAFDDINTGRQLPKGIKCAELSELIAQADNLDLDGLLIAIDALMPSLVKSFYTLSEQIAKGMITEIAAPFESYQTHSGDIISYYESFFDKYNKYLSQLNKREIDIVGEMMSLLAKKGSGLDASFHLLDDVEKVEKLIYDTVVQCFKGYPSEAFEKCEKPMLDNNMHLLLLLPQLEINNGFYYRVRKSSGSKLKSNKDLFHVPFHKREYCGTYRYSIPGYPSLYLSERLNVANLETGIKWHDSYYASCFQHNRPLRFIDLALTRDFGALWERYSLIVFYPMIMACGLKVKNPNSPYKPEYAFPQVFSQVIRLHMVESHFDGISFVSTKIEKPDFMNMDMRNYVLWIKGAEKEKDYSQELAEVFIATDPIKCCGISSTSKIEKRLKKLPFVPILV